MRRSTKTPRFLFRNPFPGKEVWVYDVEVYPNYFLLLAVNQTGKWVEFELYDDENYDYEINTFQFEIEQQTIQQLHQFVNDKNKILVGFYNQNYDDFILKYFNWRALSIITPSKIYAFSSALLELKNDNRSKWYWEIWRLELPWFRSVDCYKMPIDPYQTQGQAGGLKERAATYQWPRLQDLPVEPGTNLNPEQAAMMKPYCKNDVEMTVFQYDSIIEQIETRLELEVLYPGTSLVEQHNAGVCEKVFVHLYSKKTNTEESIVKKLQPPDRSHMQVRQILNDLPKNHVINKIQNHMLTSLISNWSTVEGDFDGVKEGLSQKIDLGNLNIKVGAGGLHSNDTPGLFTNKDNKILLDIDVASYYPEIINVNELAPEQLGGTFIEIENDLKEQRLQAKRAGQNLKNQGLKIVINSAFGKTGSQYSCMYDPAVMLSVTIIGQLSLLALVADLQCHGVNVISVNTDGVLIHDDKDKLPAIRQCTTQWQSMSGYILEETEYDLYVRRDVNNYMARDLDSRLKNKGIFDGVKGTPPIVKKALKNYFVNGASAETTVEEECDLYNFLFFFCAKRDWKLQHWGKPTQKTCRWYQSTNLESFVTKHKNDKVIKVPHSSQAVLANDVTDRWEIPSALNRGYYIHMINKIIGEIEGNGNM